MPPETNFYNELAPRLHNAGPDRLLRLLAGWRRLPELALTAEQVVEALGKGPYEPPDVLDAMLDLYARGRGTRRCGEKTPQHLMHVRTIVRDFPDAKFLCVVRDGRENALALAAMPWWTGGIRRAARLWRTYAREARRLSAEQGERFLIVHYETLVRSPAATLAGVMQFLGETFEPEQLDPSRPSGVVLDRSLPWKGAALGKIDLAQIDRRTAAAAAPLLRALDRIMHRELVLLGYPSAAPARWIDRFFRA